MSRPPPAIALSEWRDETEEKPEREMTPSMRGQIDHSGHHWTGPQEAPKKEGDEHHDVDAPDKKKVLMARSLVGVIAIILLWVTSLRVAKGIASNYVIAPGNRRVENDANYAYTVTVNERNAYVACANQQISTCNSTLYASISAEVTLTTANADWNADQISNAQNMQQICSNKLVTVLNWIKQWEQNPADPGQPNYSTSCTPTEISDLQNMVGDIGETKSAAYLVSKDYIRSVQALGALAQQSVDNRTTYDENYVAEKLAFLQGLSLQLNYTGWNTLDLTLPQVNGINLDVGLMESCTSLEGGCPNFGVRDAYIQMKTNVDADFLNAVNVGSLNYNASLDYQTQVNVVLGNVNSFFGQLRALGSALTSLGINMASAPSLYVPPLNLISIPLPTPVPPPDVLDATAIPFRTNFNTDFNTRLGNIQGIGINGINGLGGIGFQMVSMFDDYNPPPVDLQTAAISQRTAQFQTQQAAALGSYEQYSFNANLTVGNVSNPFVAPESAAPSHINFTFAHFYGGFNFHILVFTIGHVVNICLIADYVLRAIQTVRYIIVYWGKSSVGIEAVDVRKDKIASQADSRALVRVTKVVANPLFPVTIWLIFTILIMVAILAVFLPFYLNYIHGCVKTSHGTPITKNLYSIAYNYASNDGNTIIQSGLNNYDTTRSQTCGTQS